MYNRPGPRAVIAPPAPPTEQAPAEGTVAWGFRRLHVACAAIVKAGEAPAPVINRAGYVAWLSAVCAELLATPTGGCALEGLARAQDFVGGAMWIADRWQMVADAIPDKQAPEVRRSLERATVLRAMVSELGDVGEEGDMMAIVRLWSTMTANFVALCTSGKVPPKMQAPYLQETIAWSREATWIASFDLILQREFMEWIDSVVPTEEKCPHCGTVGTAASPNGSHPTTGAVACFAHRNFLPPIDRPPPGDEAPSAPISVVVVTSEEGRRMYVRGPNLWSLPGGKRKEGETARQAAAREVGEASGLVVNVDALEFAGITSSHDGQQMAIFVCGVDALRCPDGSMISEGAWTCSGGECVFMPDALAIDAYRKDWRDAYRGILTLVRERAAAPVATSPLPDVRRQRPAAEFTFGEQRPGVAIGDVSAITREGEPRPTRPVCPPNAVFTPDAATPCDGYYDGGNTECSADGGCERSGCPKRISDDADRAAGRAT